MILQILGILFGLGLIAFAVLLLCCFKVASDADDEMERLWQEMKEKQE